MMRSNLSRAAQFLLTIADRKHLMASPRQYAAYRETQKPAVFNHKNLIRSDLPQSL